MIHPKISDELFLALAQGLGITSLTEIQERTLDHLSGNAFITAQTGSGKTLAYLLPLLSKINREEKKNIALIITPTQELALQIRDVIASLNEHLTLPYTVEALIGGANINYQMERLKKRPHILIGTPGRVINLFDKKKINGQTIDYLVFDEIDAMAEKYPLLEKIKKALRKSTQTLGVSATLSANRQDFFSQIVPNYQVIESSSIPHLNENIDHYIIFSEQRHKIDLLRQLLSATVGGTSLVFLNKPDQIERVYQKLTHHHYPVVALYGEMKKEERKNAMLEFRQGLKPTLISSDLTARGVDFPHVSQVIHLDFPLSPLSYIHRAGRTARGEDKIGVSIAFVSEKEQAAIRIYERELGIKFQTLVLSSGVVYLAEEDRPKKKTPKKKTKAKAKKKGKH